MRLPCRRMGARSKREPLPPMRLRLSRDSMPALLICLGPTTSVGAPPMSRRFNAGSLPVLEGQDRPLRSIKPFVPRSRTALRAEIDGGCTAAAAGRRGQLTGGSTWHKHRLRPTTMGHRGFPSAGDGISSRCIKPAQCGHATF